MNTLQAERDELRRFEIEKIEYAERLKALQMELKRLQEECKKLKDECTHHENRSFHKERRIRQLEQVGIA